MSDDVPPDLSWFRSFPLQEQASLLEDPRQPLSELMTKRVHKAPRLWWWDEGAGRALLGSEAVRRLENIAAQLDYWWEQALSPGQREYILSHRDGELEAHYADTVKAASESPFGPPAFIVVLIKDANNNNQFRLPSPVDAYVELKASRS